MATKIQRVRIVADSNPCNPRTEWDCHAGRMICWHRRYNLGDEHNYDCDDFIRELAFEACEGLEEKVDRLENDVYSRLYDRAVDNDRDDPNEYAGRLVGNKVDKYVESIVRDGYVILPLFLMDHSGISMSTGSFNCPWDSGQVGWIVCDNETIQREFNGDRELAEKCLQLEVEVYDQYLTGDVYGFIVEEREECKECGHFDWEEVDSCWGFYGSDVRTNGMAEHLNADLVELAKLADVEYC